MGVIYGLFDPRELLELETCRYVGKTVNPMRYRLRDHIRDAEQGKQRHVHFWIRSLLRQGIEPAIQVIEEFGDEDLDGLNAAEMNWIAKGRAEGWDLTNHTDGGESGAIGYKFTDEQRARLSAIVKQRHVDDPGIAERMRQAQLARFADPEERRKTGESIATALAAMDKSDQWCPECGDGPFIGEWGLKSHTNWDHDPEPLMCEECGNGPFVGIGGLRIHRQHMHEHKEILTCDQCGEGPFIGNHGLGIHRSFCPVLNPGARTARSQQLTALYADNAELRAFIGQRVSKAKAEMDKTPTMCECGAGPFIGPSALNVHQSSSSSCTEGSVNPETTELRRQQAAAMAAEFASANGQKAARLIRRCDECGLERSAATIGSHQKATGHTGWTSVSN